MEHDVFERPYEHDTPDAPVSIDVLQMEAAARAETIGGFRSTFRSVVSEALKSDRIVEGEEVAEERLSVIDAAASDRSAIRLDTTERGVLGYT